MNPCRTPPADAGPDSDFSRGAPHLSGDPPPTPTFPPACDFACSYPRPSYRQGEGAPLRLPDRASHRKQLARRSNPEQKSRRKGVWFSRTHQNPPSEVNRNHSNPPIEVPESRGRASNHTLIPSWTHRPARGTIISGATRSIQCLEERVPRSPESPEKSLCPLPLQAHGAEAGGRHHASEHLCLFLRQCASARGENISGRMAVLCRLGGQVRDEGIGHRATTVLREFCGGQAQADREHHRRGSLEHLHAAPHHLPDGALVR